MRVGRLVLLLAAGASLTACHPRRLHRGEAIRLDTRPMRVVGRLTCPDRVDELARTGQAPDGRSCTYAGPQQEEVKLDLTPLDGQGAEARLAALDASLRAELPAAAAGPAHGQGVEVSRDTGRDQAHIDLPGFHLNASGGKASIRMPGVNINADGDDAKVVTGWGGAGGATVSAHEGGAEIRAGGVDGRGADLTYLLASDTPGPTGFRAVGYIAKGPAGGPLVVGEFRTRGHDQHDQGRHGLERLVNMNVHG
jgi:hypothetical protein